MPTVILISLALLVKLSPLQHQWWPGSSPTQWSRRKEQVTGPGNCASINKKQQVKPFSCIGW
jgi:hypothetical protein